jgi:import inner membrane translocase subunit TIM16
MVKRLLIKLLFEQGPKLLRSVLNAYKDATKDMPKGNKNTNDESFTSKLGFSNLLITPMTREEALKILNLKADPQLGPQQVMEQFDKYMEANDPEKGGSFYLQNKVYYAKEFLMNEYDPELNISKFNPDMANRPNEEATESEKDSSEEKKEEDITDKDKKI